jgi:hypothetical protein
MKLKLTTKSQIEKRLLEQKLIANKKMRIYSSASIAANPMLQACAISAVFFKFVSCPTENCNKNLKLF